MNTRAALLLMSLLCWFARPSVAAEPVDVSLVQLIANPNDYHGKFVRVIGFVKLEFESNSVYLHQDDYKHQIFKNGLWIDVTDEIRKKKDEFDQKYLLLEGTFNAKKKGHMGAWSGSIEKISRSEVWSEKEGRK